MVKNLKKFTCDLAHQLIIERIGDTQKLPVEYKERLNILKSAGTEYNVYMGEINVDNISMDVIIVISMDIFSGSARLLQLKIVDAVGR